jgi:hypothetical protein
LICPARLSALTHAAFRTDVAARPPGLLKSARGPPITHAEPCPDTMPRRALIALLLASSGLLAGCDLLGAALGIESPERVAAAREAEGKAIGGACRNAARAIEDCFALNRKADKAAVFAGWREMNDYMRENKIEPVVPQLVTKVAATKAPTDVDAPAGPPAAGAEKPAAKPDSAKPRARAKAHDS